MVTLSINTEFADGCVAVSRAERMSLREARSEIARWLWEVRHNLDVVVCRTDTGGSECERYYYVSHVSGMFEGHRAIIR